MLAAGFDLPYVQEYVGHQDPSTTLKVYAQVIRRPDRDQLRAEMREPWGEDSPEISTPRAVESVCQGHGNAVAGRRESDWERPETAPRGTHEVKRPRPQPSKPAN
jgi:hypothetical protein